MDEANVRISLKLGEIHVECEAKSEFIQNNMVSVIGSFFELCISKSDGLSTWLGSKKDKIHSEEANIDNGNNCFNMNVESIAKCLSVKSGTDLALAAASYLTFAMGRDRFTRQDLLETMKSAASYYRNSYSSNLSKTIKTLLNTNKFNANANYYSLTAKEKETIKRRFEPNCWTDNK